MVGPGFAEYSQKESQTAPTPSIGKKLV